MATDSKGSRKAKDGKSKEKKAKRAAGPDSRTKAERQAEKLAKSLGESAQHVWLAGIGALGRAQVEGSRLFASLVEEGEELERRARTAASHRADDVMAAVGTGMDDVRGKAEDTWERWEKALDERMQRTLSRMGVPSRDDVAELERKVGALEAELRRERAASARKAAARKTAVRKAPATLRTAAVQTAATARKKSAGTTGTAAKSAR